jgi:hypothetical protein
MAGRVHRPGIFQERHVLEFGLQIQHRNVAGDVDSVRCDFCQYFGRETKPGCKRNRMTSVHSWTPSYRRENYISHHKSQHPEKWADYKAFVRTAAEKATFFGQTAHVIAPPLKPPMPTTTPAEAASEVSHKDTRRGAENSSSEVTMNNDLTIPAASTHLPQDNPYASNDDSQFNTLEPRVLTNHLDTTASEMAAKLAVEAAQELPADSTTEIAMVDECDKAYAGPPNPEEVLQGHLQPLYKLPNQVIAYTELAHNHDESSGKIKKFEDKVNKHNDPEFIPNSLMIKAFGPLKLEYSMENTNDKTCQELARKFDELIPKFKADAALLIKSCKEHELALLQKEKGRQLLRDMLSTAIDSASIRILMWNGLLDDDDPQQCKVRPAIISNIAMKRFLNNSPLTPKLEKSLSIESLSDLYETLPEPIDSDDVITELEKQRTYDSLDTRTGDNQHVHQDVKQVDDLVTELNKYIPLCTLEFERNKRLVTLHKNLNGKLAARLRVKKMASATSATQQTMNNREDAAANANQQAQKAPRAHSKESPKRQGRTEANPTVQAQVEERAEERLQHERNRPRKEQRKRSSKRKRKRRRKQEKTASAADAFPSERHCKKPRQRDQQQTTAGTEQITEVPGSVERQQLVTDDGNIVRETCPAVRQQHEIEPQPSTRSKTKTSRRCAQKRLVKRKAIERGKK